VIVWYLDHPGLGRFARLGYQTDVDLLLVHSGNWKALSNTGHRIMQARISKWIDLGGTVLFSPEDVVWSAPGGKVDTTADDLPEELVMEMH